MNVYVCLCVCLCIQGLGDEEKERVRASAWSSIQVSHMSGRGLHLEHPPLPSQVHFQEAVEQLGPELALQYRMPMSQVVA